MRFNTILCFREDFHFTPYSTISYLEPGPKADFISSHKLAILIPGNSVKNSFEKHCQIFSTKQKKKIKRKRKTSHCNDEVKCQKIIIA